jgi:DNA polymerase I-like protein with 3'-5' exonuclease and polymerase domains
MAVYDIEVENDHSYLAGGVFNHNSSMPNLQNQPSRSKDAKNLIRGLFRPEDGCVWAKTDYSQIEYRIFAHYAVGQGAEELRTAFNLNPELDMHQATADKAGCSRSTAKTVNFGVIYGMGANKLARTISVANPQEFLAQYHAQNPFLKQTMRSCSRTAETRGYVKTVLGRRARLDKERSFVALNRVVQGSAAEVMKLAMLKTWEAGIYNVLTPHLTVHDEMDVSVPLTPEGIAALAEQKYIFENALKFKVPLLTETEVGTSWADANKEQFEVLKTKFLA